MPQHPSLAIEEAGVAYTVTFQSDKPYRTGTNEYGVWENWRVTYNGETHSFFPSEPLMEAIHNLGPRAGMVVDITKHVKKGEPQWFEAKAQEGPLASQSPTPSEPPPEEPPPEEPPPLIPQVDARRLAAERYYLVVGCLRMAQKAYQEVGYKPGDVPIDEIGRTARTVLMDWPKNVPFPRAE